MRKKIWCVLVAILLCASSFGQTSELPYKHSVGITTGTLNGFSYKGFTKKHCAVQFDIGYKITGISASRLYLIGWGESYNLRYDYGLAPLETFEANLNVMFDAKIVKGLHLFVGGGLCMGMSFNSPINNAYENYYDYYHYYDYDYNTIHVSYMPGTHYITGKSGMNFIFGLEYKFDIPLALTLDTRPGSGILFENAGKGYVLHYFDWSLQLGVRYAF